jgi:pyruvate/2-oxoglutarate dehydrogenase complex dihydrolipoamide acyltransferase (E2) component
VQGVGGGGHRCPLCGKEYSERKSLVRHITRVHGITEKEEVDRLLSGEMPPAPTEHPPPAPTEQMPPAPAEQQPVSPERQVAAEEREVVLTVKGIRITRGDVVRAVVGKSVYIFRVTEFTETLPVVTGVDIYGNEISIDLRKAIVIAKMPPEKFDVLRERARELEVRRKKKEEGGQQ